MRRIFTLIACLLAVLWLPVTLHCGLETAGLWLHEHGLKAADTGCSDACKDGACAVVENGAYKKPTCLLKVSAPVLALCLRGLIEIPADTMISPPVSPDKTDSPPELACTWQFTTRTAPLPGAPSLS